MSEPLTPVERKVYQYLIDFLAENTYQPSIREIGKKFRIKSTKTVSDLLHSLTAKGYIQRDPSRSRGVRIIGYQGPAGVQPLPYYGRVHAGEPSLLPEHREGSLTFDRRFVASDDTFVLRVKGDSMIGRGIHDGDYVLVTPTRQPRDGEVVAARLGAEATVKTYERVADGVLLRAANPEERDIGVRPGDDFEVLGVVTGLFRPSVDRDLLAGGTPLAQPLTVQ
jgi:repressor LexA